jgi:hypothetical protein
MRTAQQHKIIRLITGSSREFTVKEVHDSITNPTCMRTVQRDIKALFDAGDILRDDNRYPYHYYRHGLYAPPLKPRSFKELGTMVRASWNELPLPEWLRKRH